MRISEDSQQLMHSVLQVICAPIMHYARCLLLHTSHA